MQCSTAHHSAAQHSTAQHGTARQGPVRHNTARHGTAQPGTEQSIVACQYGHSNTAKAYCVLIPVHESWTQANSSPLHAFSESSLSQLQMPANQKAQRTRRIEPRCKQPCFHQPRLHSDLPICRTHETVCTALQGSAACCWTSSFVLAQAHSSSAEFKKATSIMDRPQASALS